MLFLGCCLFFENVNARPNAGRAFLVSVSTGHQVELVGGEAVGYGVRLGGAAYFTFTRT